MAMEEKSRVFCNKCGREIRQENGILKEDIFTAKKEWGYFSEKDLEIHDFQLCETCYDGLVKTFRIPVQITEKKEVLSESVVK